MFYKYIFFRICCTKLVLANDNRSCFIQFSVFITSTGLIQNFSEKVNKSAILHLAVSQISCKVDFKSNMLILTLISNMLEVESDEIGPRIMQPCQTINFKILHMPSELQKYCSLCGCFGEISVYRLVNWVTSRTTLNI